MYLFRSTQKSDVFLDLTITFSLLFKLRGCAKYTFLGKNELLGSTIVLNVVLPKMFLSKTSMYTCHWDDPG